MWQDYVIAIVQWLFVLALIPTLLHKDEKPPFLTSILLSASIAVLGITYITLALSLSTLPAFIQAALWMLIAVQRFRINTRKGIPVVGMPSRIRRN